MRLIEWEVAEDNYQEQIIIPADIREIAEEEGINTENKGRVTVQIINMHSGEIYTGRVPITGNRQIYLPVEIQRMLKGSEKIRIQILGG